MQAIVLAAGKGTRMKSGVPKVLHKILGQPLIEYVLDSLKGAGVKKPVVVVGAGAEKLKAYLGSRVETVLQQPQHGTGHAVAVTEKKFRGAGGHVIIWPGDMPLIEKKTLRAFVRKHMQAGCEVSVLSACRENPKGYGRIIRSGKEFTGIREEVDANESERRIKEVNTGVYVFKLDSLWKAIRQVTPKNRQKEYYLTDTIEVLVRQKGRVQACCLASENEGLGVNSRRELAQAAAVLNQRTIDALQDKGVTFVAPAQTFVEPGVVIGQDTVVYPWTYIERDVKIGSGCEIGPFAKIRKGTRIASDCVVGSFVEVNRSRLGRGVTAKHLTYLGDALIGDGTNIGAGTITANFDGRHKHQTRIGKKVLIGSDTVLIAPASVGDGAKTGAGSVIPANRKVLKGEVVAGVPVKTLKKSK